MIENIRLKTFTTLQPPGIKGDSEGIIAADKPDQTKETTIEDPLQGLNSASGVFQVQKSIKATEVALTETANTQNILDFIQNIPFEAEYADWKDRIPKFLEKYRGTYRMIYIQDMDGTNCGFCIISDSKDKLSKWSKKIQSAKWIQVPINIKTSVQFAYFYIFPEKRGCGRGTLAIEKIKAEQKDQGKKTIYGFSRYANVIPLYQRTGAKILHQEQNRDESRTYYYWNLADEK